LPFEFQANFFQFWNFNFKNGNQCIEIYAWLFKNPVYDNIYSWPRVDTSHLQLILHRIHFCPFLSIITDDEYGQKKYSTTTTLGSQKLLLTGGRCSWVALCYKTDMGLQNGGHCWQMVVIQRLPP